MITTCLPGTDSVTKPFQVIKARCCGVWQELSSLETSSLARRKVRGEGMPLRDVSPLSQKRAFES